MSQGQPGAMFPDATLPMRGGGAVTFNDLRVRWNLVVIFLGNAPLDAPVAEQLLVLARAGGALAAEDAKAFAVVPTRPGAVTHAWDWPAPLLVDERAALHRRVGAVNAFGEPSAAVYITDRYREIYAVFRDDQPAWPPMIEDVRDWLVFVNLHCAECNRSEW